MKQSRAYSVLAGQEKSEKATRPRPPPSRRTAFGFGPTCFVLLAALFCLLTFMPQARAAEPQPGDACSFANRFTRSGGPELSGKTYFMSCQGGVWSLLFATDAPNGIGLDVNGAFTMTIPNDGTTGTTQYDLAGLTGAPSTAILASASQASGIIGIVQSGAGTTGSAYISYAGQATCIFDGATTAGDWVQASSTAGSCHDAGATLPTSGAEIIGIVTQTIGSAGNALMDVALQEPAGGGSQTPWTSNINAAGYTLDGNSTASGNLTLDSTSNATKGYVLLNPTGGNVGIGTATPSAVLHISPAVSNIAPAFRVTGATNTTYNTASTETPDLDLALGRTETWAAGSFATQRAVKIAAPTYASTGGGATITDAATLGITGAPAEGSKATLTNAHGILISAGAVGAATNSYGLTVNAQTGATNNYAAEFLGGNVGIGNSAPGALLDIGNDGSTVGTMRLENSVSGDYVQIQPSTSATASVTYTLPTTAGTSGYVLSTDGTGVLSWIAAGGGSQTPWTSNINAAGYTLDGNSTASGNLTLDSTSNATKGYVLLNPTGGNVGIGNTAPGALLDVGKSATTLGTMRLENSVSGDYVQFQPSTSATASVTYTMPTTAGTSGQVLSTDGTGVLSWATASGGSGGPIGSDTQIAFNDAGTESGSANLVWNYTTNALTVTGDMNFSGILTNTSDARLKKDIRPLSETGNILAKIMHVGTYSYIRKNNPDNRVEYGVVAQQLEKTFPALVITRNDAMHTKSVDYLGLIAPLISSVQQLKTENDALQASNANMRKTIDKMAADIAGLKAVTGYGIRKAGFGEGAITAMIAMLALFLSAGAFRNRRKSRG